MTKSEHLQFLALMLPTVLLLILAAVSLADPAADLAQVAAEVSIPHASVDDPAHETAY